MLKLFIILAVFFIIAQTKSWGCGCGCGAPDPDCYFSSASYSALGGPCHKPFNKYAPGPCLPSPQPYIPAACSLKTPCDALKVKFELIREKLKSFKNNLFLKKLGGGCGCGCGCGASCGCY